jgi:hypothetical protein
MEGDGLFRSPCTGGPGGISGWIVVQDGRRPAEDSALGSG